MSVSETELNRPELERDDRLQQSHVVRRLLQRPEVGAIIVVGGNIRGSTRTMTTAIALETSKGDLALALALGLVLIALSVAVTATAFGLERRASAV